MKMTLTLIFSFFSSIICLAQVSENFSDSDLNSNPEWVTSDDNHFIVSDAKLRSNSSTINSSFYISTTNSLSLNAKWEFWINLQFSTSGSNYCDVYLTADKSDLKSNLINGYFVRIGNTEDEISLYRRTGTLNSATEIIDGQNSSVGSSNNAMKIEVERNAEGIFTLKRQVGTSTWHTEGIFQDTVITESGFFGIYIQQSTASFFNKHFFDDIVVSAIEIDTVAPMITNIRVLDSLKLELNFSEIPDSISVLNTGNYHLNDESLDGVINRTTDSLRFLIKLNRSLPNGNSHLIIYNLTDKSGNVRAMDSIVFVYNRPYQVKTGDIVINEIFSDPTPQIDLPAVEFIELYNSTNQKIVLDDWSFSDPSVRTRLTNAFIEAYSYLILCSKNDTNEFKHFGKVLGLSPWPSLNNTGDVLWVKNESELLIDSVKYSDAWYRNSLKKPGGWSLERRINKIKCEEGFNWAASVDSTGGTPGRINSLSLLANSREFKLDTVYATSDSSLLLLFNDHIDPSTLISDSFRPEPTMSISSIFSDQEFKSIEISFSNKFEPGDFILAYGGLKSCEGYSLDSALSVLRINFPEPPPPPPVRLDTARIFITEIFPDPSPEQGLPLSEFVEIYNPGTDTINLDGWILTDMVTKAGIKSKSILPGEYLVLCRDADTLSYQSFGRTIGVYPWPSLANASDRIVLKSFLNRTVDSISYSDSWYRSPTKKQGGWTLEKVDLESDCEIRFNWTASIDSSGGTPGKANSVSTPAPVALMTDSLQRTNDSTLIVYFNKHLNAATLINENFYLSPLTVPKYIVGDPDQKIITIVFSEKFKPGLNTLVIKNVSSCFGEYLRTGLDSLQFTFLPPPPPPPLRTDTSRILITEILPDPSPEVALPLVEFIEIHNPGLDTVEIEGWSISDNVSKGIIGKEFILPNEYLILCRDADTSHYQPFGRTLGIKSWPVLGNNSDKIVLKSFKNRPVDSLNYSDTWYRSLLKKQGGWSLERIDFESKCVERFNWTASVDSSGGTPGKVNSVLMTIPAELRADSLQRINDSTLIVFFNKHLDPASLVTDNFYLTPSTMPKSIVGDSDQKTITLTFSEKFKVGLNTLLIKTLSTCNGEFLRSDSLGLTFTILAPPPPPQPPPLRTDTARILVTEILPDPSPEVKLPLVEFVEIFNPGLDTVDLQGWSISDYATKGIIGNGNILPNEYIILCREPDTIYYQAYGKTLGIKSWPALGNSADKVVLRSFNNRPVDSLTYSDTWYRSPIKKQGGWSLERIDLDSKCEGLFNWTASSDLAGGTPGRKNSVYMEDIALEFDTLKILSDSTISVRFNTRLDPSGVRSQNFTIAPGSLTITSIEVDVDYQLMLLTIKEKFVPGENYRLIIKDLISCNSKKLDSLAIPFSIPKIVIPPPPPSPPVRPDTGKILITEIMIDPSPEIGLPLAEFVEVYNPGGDSIELDGWSLTDLVTKGNLKETVIQPGEYLILCRQSDTLFFNSYGRTVGLATWPSLNNSSDHLVLKSFKNRTVDSVHYSDDWYRDSVKRQGGWTLERISLSENACSPFYNWTSSIDSMGGSPGKVNSAASSVGGEVNLQLDSITVLSANTLKIFFNTIPDTSSLKTATVSISNNEYFPTKKVDPSFKTITLTFEQDFKESQEYNLELTKLRNCDGRVASLGPVSFVIPGIAEKEYPIIITEILADPNPAVGLPDAEFVELFNPTNENVDLSGMQFGNLTRRIAINAGNIPSQSYLILCAARDTASFLPFGRVLGIPNWITLPNTGGTIVLANNKNDEFQRVNYNLTSYRSKRKEGGGYTLELTNMNSKCVASQNWTGSNDPLGGTPGQVNSVFSSGQNSHDLLISNLTLLDSIKLKVEFNSTIDSSSMSLNSNYRLNNGIGNPIQVEPLSPDFNAAILTFAIPLRRGHHYTLEVSQLFDCSGKLIDAAHSKSDFYYPEQIQVGDILISEIMFNPKPKGVDFLEIYNNSDNLIDLNELSIGRIVSDSITNAQKVSQTKLLMEPGAYLALTTDPDQIKSAYFVQDPDAIIKLSPMPPFNDDQGTVVILRMAYRIDEFSYDENMHYPLYKNVEGVSLERSNFNIPSNVAGNFRSATSSSGYGTPGYQNSQYTESLESEEEFIFQSPTFSPDNDGFEDVMNLKYTLSKPGFIANLTIYNSRGILVRKLLKNFMLSQEGNILWDGFDERQSLANAGIYILDLSLFDTEGKVRNIRKSIVLATRL